MCSSSLRVRRSDGTASKEAVSNPPDRAIPRSPMVPAIGARWPPYWTELIPSPSDRAPDRAGAGSHAGQGFAAGRTEPGPNLGPGVQLRWILAAEGVDISVRTLPFWSTIFSFVTESLFILRRRQGDVIT